MNAPYHPRGPSSQVTQTKIKKECSKIPILIFAPASNSVVVHVDSRGMSGVMALSRVKYGAAAGGTPDPCCVFWSLYVPMIHAAIRGGGGGGGGISF